MKIGDQRLEGEEIIINFVSLVKCDAEQPRGIPFFSQVRRYACPEVGRRTRSLY